MTARCWTVVVLLGSIVQVGMAQEPGPPVAYAPGSPAHCVPPPCTKTVHSQQVILYEKEVAATVPQVNIREVITRVPTMTVNVEYKEVKQQVVVMVPKPHEVERVVESITCVPEVTIDPCTGCACTTYKHIPICKVVKEQVFVPEPEIREVIVKVPVLRPVESEVVYQHFQAEGITTAVKYNSMGSVFLPSAHKLPAPPCPALPPCPPPSCPHPEALPQLPSLPASQPE